jgi:flagellar hook-associated protein 1 FlgK
MSFNMFQTGVSGLLGFQTALSTVGHNIANAATEGYSRQRTEFSARPGDFMGRLFIGNGTEVSAIRRVFDQFLTGQVFRNTASLSRLDTFYNMSSQIDNVLGDPSTSISSGLQSFYGAVQTLSSDPASLAARESMLAEANALVERFRNIDLRLNDLESEVNARLGAAVSEINALTSSIAEVNRQIAHTSASGAVPNDLLDQRDELLRRLNEQIEVSTVTQDDGSVNVFIGNGLPLVHGFQAEELGLAQNDHLSVRQDITYKGAGGAPVPVTGDLGGGIVGGALDFRREVLDPTRSSIGRVALAFAETFNAQHREGMDLYGELGGDFFSVGAPLTLPASSNTGSAIMTSTIADLGALTGQEYVFSFDGTDWHVHDAATNAPVAFTGTGTPGDPFVVGGVAVEVSGAAAAGDTFLVQPTAGVIDGMSVLVTDPSRIAAAAPIATEAALSNTGLATIDAGIVLDPTNPALLDTVTIEFVDANNYSINGGPPIPYTSGEPIEVNGWSVTIQGVPAAGDTFTVKSNAGATGDNRNALLLAGLQTEKILNGASQTLEAAYGTLVAQVGGETQQAALMRDAQALLLEQSEQSRYAVSGVNLDEEAANLLRFQQAYSAAAQVVRAADEIFDILLGAIGR